MAILIPSKNIYNKDHKLVRDNILKGCTFELFDTSSNLNMQSYYNSGVDNLGLTFNAEASTDSTIGSLNLGDLTNTQFKSEYKYTSSDDVGYKYTKYWQIIDFELEAKKYFTNIDMSNLYNNITFFVKQMWYKYNAKYELIDDFPKNEVIEYVFREDLNSLPFHTAIQINTKPTIDNIQSIVDKEGDYRILPTGYLFVYFQEIDKKKIKGSFLVSLGVVEEAAPSITFPNLYIPASAYVSSNSGQIEIKMKIGDLEVKESEFSINTQGIVTFAGNELAQKQNLISKNVREEYYTVLGNEIISSWQNGKETATIRCSISDYYDTNDVKAISIDNSTGKMSFNMYDQVIPMVYGADGKDRPMSTYKDGTPKVFSVLGSNIFYDGAVWQELSLQEVDKT